MTYPNAIFPNETYLNGLRDADPAVVDGLYNEFRLPVSKAVEVVGGSYADGSTFFRVAVIQASRLVHSGNYPTDAPIFLVLKNLAVAQYRDWLNEKGQAKADTHLNIEEDAQIIHALPDSTQLRELRQQVRAKRTFARLNQDDQRHILTLANSTMSGLNVPDSMMPVASIERFKALLEQKEKIWEKPLPTWLSVALSDQHFSRIWMACEALEQRITSGQPLSGKIPNENKAIRNAFLLFIALTLGYGIYTWVSRDRSPAKVYDNNFQPPASILDDMTARYAKDSVASSRPEACTIAFKEADVHYKKREWHEAASTLAAMMDDSLEVCQSDALFYLAIVGLQLDKPELTVECIAKIQDLDRFGEDIYWYMALAYVKMAALDPSQKDTARRALERALSNTEVPERRTQAKKMLKELAE